MDMSTITKVVCDVCGADAVSYSIEGEGRRANVDLCPVHSEPVTQLLDKYQVRSKRRAARGSSRRSTYADLRADSIEEVEAAKDRI